MLHVLIPGISYLWHTNTLTFSVRSNGGDLAFFGGGGALRSGTPLLGLQTVS